MPPKKGAAPAQASGARGQKARRSNTGAAQAAEDSGSEAEGGSGGAAAATAAAAGKVKSRYSAHSGSANLEAEYRMKTEDKAKAYEFVCLCMPPFKEQRDEEDESEDEEEEEEEEAADEADAGGGNGRPCCDGGKTCVCMKPAAEHPEHPWVSTLAGLLRFKCYYVMTDLRSPDNFDMYTFNDHEGYGWVQVLQNVLLDYEDAAKAKNWKEQWAVCEGAGKLLKDAAWAPLCMVDDGEGLTELILAIGAMFLDALHTLQGEGQLSATSEVRDVALVTAMFAKFAAEMRPCGALDNDEDEDEDEEDGDGEPDGSSSSSRAPTVSRFDDAALGYARKHSVKLPQGGAVAKILAGCSAADPAKMPGPDKKDPWGFRRRLAALGEGAMAGLWARSAAQAKTIGGDSLDLTSWSSAERKSKAFDNKDPLSKEAIAALKRGDILQIG